ncbi:MAG TPA: xanthine dehydrogenase family protein molybdopterin-binding subunit [Candidatus Dormibacteraeota bacterium]|nr:xanthine dehydrogenase family protein molybdopterin-binding subunit [Candidatus Dormibacteraeota bacterium]
MAVKASRGGVVKRREDPRLVTGRGRFTADVAGEGWLHAAFVRTSLAHARIGSIDVEAAAGMPGVAGVYLAQDLGLKPYEAPAADALARPPIASEVVRFVGDIVAVVVAETRGQAADAAAAVAVEYEPLQAVVDPIAALAPGSPLVHAGKGDNRVSTTELGEPGAIDRADVVVRARFVNQRLAAVPLEANAVAAEPDGDGGIRMWASTQVPFSVRFSVSEITGIPEEKIRVIAPDVGGAFGAKLATYPEQSIVAALAHRLGRPVEWVESRSENLTAMTHGRAQIQDVALGATREGKVVGIEATITSDVGAYPVVWSTAIQTYTAQMSPNVYAIPAVHVRVEIATTNTTTVSAYRGAGRPEAIALIERAMDMLALELEMDPADLRRRNLIEGDFPYATATGMTYDSGDYRRALEAALEVAGYDGLRAEQRARRARGDRLQLGIGISCYVEVTGVGSPGEHGAAKAEPDGSFTIHAGTTPSGQGHETAFAQVASAALGVPPDRIRVLSSDTGVVASGDGSYGSRSLQIGGSAVRAACVSLIEKARDAAAHHFEASVDDIERKDGGFGVRGVPGSLVTWAELASRAPLGAEEDFYQFDQTFPFGCHVAVVEVDVETGEARAIRHVAVDDCGTVLNPMLVEGQIHGGVAQGVAQALYEEVVYDEDGNPRTGTLTDYAVPTIGEIPAVETISMETPTPNNPLGAKGVGESGTIGSTPAVQNAVVDAVSYLGVRHIDMPLNPMRVWEAISLARRSP